MKLQIAEGLSLPAEILSQHVAVLGKTGSGKTSTAKLLVEQVVADGARVCVLDPIKSDWWGLTSSADGTRAGLPFHILGGPRGHVPLHASAGKAVAEIVASGALPLSIIDMADFEPGGQAEFFVHFAPALLRKMRGVVYLVIEEAHLFAPKERSGVGKENLSIHWAKTLATAGRSKGVRLVLVTQRTQALHNALLGSCDTMIAHRLTAPADQEPVVKWLKANTSKEVLEQVSASLSSLKTGDAWLCSGEAKRFEVVHFPRIATYDNTATPTGDGDTRVIKTAAVDQEKLRAIIGDAVEQAKADDPRELRRQIAELKKHVDGRIADAMVKAVAEPKVVEILSDADRALLARIDESLAIMRKGDVVVNIEALVTAVQKGLNETVAAAHKAVVAAIDTKRFQDIARKLAAVQQPIPGVEYGGHYTRHPHTPAHSERVAGHPPAASQGRRDLPGKVTGPYGRQAGPASLVSPSLNGDGSLPSGERRVLVACAQYPGGVSREQLTILTGYKRSTRDLYLQGLSRRGFLVSDRDRIAATDAGIHALGDFERLPTGDALRVHWMARLPGGERAVLEVVTGAHPRKVSRDTISDRTGYKRSTRDLYLQALQRRKLIATDREGVVAAEELFG